VKLLLLSANRERSPYPVFPIGLAYLVEPLRAAGHDLTGLDLGFTDDPPAAVAAALDNFSPDAVLVSLRNVDNVTYPGSRSYLAGVREALAPCRDRVPFIIGGSGFSLMPREILAFLGADIGVIGEGEEVLPLLLARLAAGENLEGLPGVVRAGTADHLPPQPVERIGRPDRQLFDVARYHREGGMVNLQTKRGCPFSCSYCTYPLLEGRRIRLRPVPEILVEIRDLVDVHGVSYLYFVDDIFNYPPEFAEELCRALARERLPVNWAAFINPDFLPPSLLEAMQAAGCDALEFGTDAGTPLMLYNLGKSFTVEKVREASRRCREAGVDFAHYILFGGPGETAATIRETFALMDELAPTAIIAMTGIRIFPGTELHRQALAEGVISTTTDLLEPAFYLAPGVREELCAIVTDAALLRRNWVVPGLEINISDAMLEALRQFPVRGPLWKMVKRLGRTVQHPLEGNLRPRRQG